MVWIKSNEQYLFTGNESTVASKLKEQISKERPYINLSFLDNCTFLLEPTISEVKEVFTFGNDFEKVVILSSQHPIDAGFGKENFFSVIEVKGEHYPFTKEQLWLGIPKEELLQVLLGLTFKKTKKTLSDMAGAENLRYDTKYMLDLERLGIMSIAGLFLFGVAGAGKSYFAECFAGETGRHYVVLDLPYFMTLPSPTRAVDIMFDFLEAQDEKYLLLIDEIEKMFDFEGGNLIAKQVFGKLLTRLNDIYANPKNNVTFVATANNITGIMKNSPEFLRKGRFNRLYFLGYPDIDNAEKIFSMYKSFNKKRIAKAMVENYDKYLSGNFESTDSENSFLLLIPYLKEVQNGTYSLDDLTNYFFLDFNITRNIRYIDTKFSSLKVSDSDRFIYSPPEIQAVSEELQNKAFIHVLKQCLDPKELNREKAMVQYEDNDQFTMSVVVDIVPLQISASEGISRQIAQSKSYTGKEAGDVQQFIDG